jgi:class 3 adenylate cyclase
VPLYLDIHEVGDATPEEIAKIHFADVAKQGKHNVEYRKYWLNEARGKVFCLVHAPNAEAACCVHREAHGHVADKVIEVDPDLAEGFLGGGEINAAGAVVFPGGGSEARDPGIRTVFFTDIVGSTNITQRFGDEVAMEFLHYHDATVREALSACNGREVKHTGDGIMASFASAASAVRCAAQIQREFSRGSSPRKEHRMQARIGAAAGEPVEHGNDIFGTTVQLAARLCAHAEPEQILVSNVVAELCIGKQLAFRPLGHVHLKGFDEPVHVHTVDWPNEQAI